MMPYRGPPAPHMVERRDKRGNLYYTKTARTWRPYTEKQAATIRGLAAHGYSVARIAVNVDRNVGSVADFLRRHGIKTNGGPGGQPSHRRNQHAAS